ncbi:unnamed protein product [Cylindrotheca closterium]|uniref:Uncharacterized protein n=1 Tax=Cylindrotheca closterium TaxID=2856 RepID=A0AAD2G8D3_9STRA|nr:unnamed protein product [Cylindrotheca closterium]
MVEQQQRGGQAEKEELEPRTTRRNRVMAPAPVEKRPEDAEGEYMHGIEMGSRMMSVAAKRIVLLEQALRESQERNATMEQQMTKFYEDKIAKLHRAQMYSVDRMGQRIDVLEDELMSRTNELEMTREKLCKAVEKVVVLQQEVASFQQQQQPIVDLGSVAEKKEEMKNTQPKKVTTKTSKPKRRSISPEEKSYPSSAGSEGVFEGIVMSKNNNNNNNNKCKNNNNKNKRCKVEPTWDEGAIVPDSYMTSVMDSPTTTSNNKNHQQNNKDAGLSRFFHFGQKNKDATNAAAKPSDLAVRPNVIEDFYEVCSNGSLPDTIMFSGIFKGR